jgi:hypothetical protein
MWRLPLGLPGRELAQIYFEKTQPFSQLARHEGAVRRSLRLGHRRVDRVVMVGRRLCDGFGGVRRMMAMWLVMMTMLMAVGVHRRNGSRDWRYGCHGGTPACETGAECNRRAYGRVGEVRAI